MRTRLIPALLAGLALAGAACSSDSTTTATSTTTAAVTTTTAAATTKAEFITAGNAICKDMNTKSAAITAALPGGKPTTNEDYAKLFTENGDLIATTLEQLKALPQPSGDAETLEAVYADVEALIGWSRKGAAAYRSGDATTAQAARSEGSAVQNKANASSNAYGLTECGKGS